MTQTTPTPLQTLERLAERPSAGEGELTDGTGRWFDSDKAISWERKTEGVFQTLHATAGQNWILEVFDPHLTRLVDTVDLEAEENRTVFPPKVRATVRPFCQFRPQDEV